FCQNPANHGKGDFGDHLDGLRKCRNYSAPPAELQGFVTSAFKTGPKVAELLPQSSKPALRTAVFKCSGVYN
ncbi:MAG TPA: hypothetical protein PK992_14200, partial [Planctomycetaceae bacterium]|nr:hypothetical protein [Planctomycetaceae bacterium]